MSKRDISVFVSRPLDSNSELRKYLENIPVDLEAISLIDFSPISFPLPNTDWLFFYSKSGVRFFFNQLNPYVNLGNYKYASFGQSTGKYLKNKIGRGIDYCGNSNANAVLTDLVKKIGKDAICFVVGKNSLRSIQTLLPVEIDKKEIIVYNNQPRKLMSLNHYDIAIITSPMNAETFIKAGGSADHYISIGNTTSTALQHMNIDSIIAESPSEFGITVSIKNLYSKYYGLNTE